jgi:UrcA family protein
MISRIITTALAIAVLVSAAQAKSQPIASSGDNRPLVSQKVRFADLNPSTEAGAERLAFRIRTAANEVCLGDDPTVRSGVGLEACMKATIAAVEARLNAPLVTAALDHQPGMTLAHR